MLARMPMFTEVLMGCRLKITSLFFSVISFYRFLRCLPPETVADFFGRCISKVSP
jgi:hypothetical protein